MDRDLRWERVEEAYKMLTQGAERTAASAAEAIQSYYDNPTEPSRSGDEFITATSITADGKCNNDQGRRRSHLLELSR